MSSKTKQIWGHAAPKPTADQWLATREDANRVTVDFLKTDLQTAFTFVKVARLTKDGFRRERSCRAARKAYDTVTRMAPRVEFRPNDSLFVTRELAYLKRELQSLGEHF